MMLQQTPVARVLPVWTDWLARWPAPSSLAAATAGDAIRRWGRLGYPRRALRLHGAAVAITEGHGGQVPSTYANLLSLPGIGSYTAAAVASFAFGARHAVVDTNVRRVQARAVTGDGLPAPALTRRELQLAESLLPDEDEAVARWNVAVMELGALVCTARAPGCDRCPLRDHCAWQRAGAPPYEGRPHPVQSWQGTDRQMRGRLMAALRATDRPLDRGQLGSAAGAAAAEDAAQLERCLRALVADGLVQPMGERGFALPS